MEKIGENIKEVRIKQNLSQKNLAEKCNCKQSMICYIEKGDRNPSLAMLFKLASALGTTVDTLIKGVAL